MKWISFLVIALAITACSPINSVQPFDAEQANILIRESWLNKTSKQMIAIRLPRAQCWIKTGNPITLYPSGQNSNNWHERIDSRRISYAKNPGMTALRYARNQILCIKQACRSAPHEIISVSEHAVIFSLDICGCRQIAKVFNGKDAVYWVRYSARGVTPQRVAHMSRVIEDTKLINNKC